MNKIFDAIRKPAKTVVETTDGDASELNVPPSPHQSQLDNLEALRDVVCNPSPEDRIVTCGQNYNLAAEKFRLLRHLLIQLRQHRPLSKLLVTSAVPREGKTVVAINLAITLAQDFSRVVLVDGDLRQPSIHRTLRLDCMPGLAEFMEGKLSLADSIRRLDPLGIHYLPAGRVSTNPFEILQNPRLRDLISSLESAFDWVVFDSPPLAPFADAHHLASVTDAVLMVVRPGVTPREPLQQGLTALKEAYVPGLVLNAWDDTREDQYYHRYYPSAPARVVKNSWLNSR